MGSTPESIRYVLQQLQCRPHAVVWSQPHQVTLSRGANNKLGFHFKTYPCGQDETVTVILLVKADCRVSAGALHVGDRIVSIGNLPVTGLDETAVKHVFSHLQGSLVNLQVSVMSRADPSTQIKRFLSVNSGASSSSATASVDSAERPQVKRFAKSSSTETPPPSSPLTDLEQPATVLPHSPQLPKPSGGVGGASRARYLSQLSTHNQVHSLPARMEDDIILTDDIVLCERDGPNSLPHIPLPLPNTPSPPSATAINQHPASIFATTVSTGIGGTSPNSGGGGGGEPNAGAAGSRSLGVEVCRAPGCSMHKMCLWHRFVLGYPQYVIWEAATKTVVLDKRDSASFGFKYKVKKYDGPPAEVFALVTEVVSGGVAWTLLLPGDWIRSINGTPVNTAKEAFRPDFRNLSSLRLVIQRPEGLSPKGIARLRQQARSMRVSLHIPVPPLSDPSSQAPQPQPAPNNSNNVGHGPAQPAPRGTPRQFVCLKGVGGDGGGGGVGVGGAGVGPGRDPNTAASPVLSDPTLEQYPRLAQSPGEHIPLATLAAAATSLHSNCSVLDKCVLPRARVVVCGAHGSAADFVRGLLGDCGSVGPPPPTAASVVDPEASVQSFHLSLHRSADFGTLAHPRPEPLAPLAQEWEPTVHGGAGSPRRERERALRCLNVELYVVSNEEFFHHCAAWLLPTAALVLLTFDVHKLLNQPEPETRRLATMVHTVRACSDSGGGSCGDAVGAPCPEVVLYGVPSGSQRDVSAEEVQAIFYVTDSGSRLLEHHALTVPSVAVPACSDSMAAARCKLFSACQDHVQQVPVHQPALKVVDALSGLTCARVSGRDLSAMVARATGDADLATLQAVVQDLLVTGTLVLCGGSRVSSEVLEQDYLLPLNLFSALSSFLIKPLLDTHSPESHQRWFRLMTTARVSRSELLDILASESSVLTLDILEHLGIVFKFQSGSPSSQGDSGFTDDSVDFVIPYFLMDLASDGEDGDGNGSEGQQFVLTFQGYLSWRNYFDMLSTLSSLPSTEQVLVQGQLWSTARHSGMRLHLHWRKHSDTDNLLVSVVRCDRQSGEGVTTQLLERLFSFIIPPMIPFKLQQLEAVNPSSFLSSGLQAAPSASGRPTGRNNSTDGETLCKPAAASSKRSGRASSRESAQSDLPLTALPWGVLHQVAILLTVSMATGHDWKSVAGQAGKSTTEILAYEAIKSQEVPAMTFLREWILTGTVQQFLKILDDIDRPDVRDLILNHLKERAQRP